MSTTFTRPEQAEAIAALEARRIKAGITRAQVALLIPCSLDTLRCAVRDGRVKVRTLNAWRMALRTLTRAQD
jgi:hypothetical protein